jgi:hypothetical protein
MRSRSARGSPAISGAVPLRSTLRTGWTGRPPWRLLPSLPPLVERELLRAGRSLHTYLARTYLAVIALVIATIVWCADRFSGTDIIESAAPDMIGRYFAYLAVFFQYLVVILMAPGMAAPALVSEKEEGTLELLILADRRRWDVIAAKFAAVLIQVEMLILCTLPLQAAAALFGGVNVAGMALQAMLISVIAFVVCALGIFFSTVCRTITTTTLAIFVTVVAWFTVTGQFDMWRAGGALKTNLFLPIPAIAFTGRFDMGLLPALGIAAILGFGALALAIWALPRQIDQKPAARSALKQKWMRRRRHRSYSRFVRAAAAEDRSMLGRVFSLLALMLLVLLHYVGWLIALLLFLRANTRALGRFRSNGGLEDLLLTRATEHQIAFAMFRTALSRCPLYSLPIAISLLVMWRVMPAVSPAELVAAIVAIWASQFTAAAAIACFAATIRRPLRAQERYANLVYLVGVIMPIPVPHLAVIAYELGVGPSARALDWLTGPPLIVWTVFVAMAAAAVFYGLTVRRIRRKAPVEPSGGDHPLLALLRP